jgi:hypothetical protein
MKIVLHIDRLVLDGFALNAHAAGALERTLIEELTQRLRSESAPHRFAQSEAQPRLQAPAITIPAQPAPAKLGRDIARSVHAGLTR